MLEVLYERRWFIFMKLCEFPVSSTFLKIIDLITLLEHTELVHIKRLRTLILSTVTGHLLVEKIQCDLILKLIYNLITQSPNLRIMSTNSSKSI